ncbi:MAG: N-acetylmuramoyl-L-alanine amidase family protein [Lentimonas sp.]
MQSGISLWLAIAATLLSTPTTAPAQGGGRDYVDLKVVSERFGMQGYWLAGHKTYRLRSRWTSIDAVKNSKSITINRVPVYLGFPTREWKGRLLITKDDYKHVLLPILTPQVFGTSPELKRIIIDPGHGGRDSGAVNDAYGLKEKTLAMDVSLRLKSMLERAGYEVVLTRYRDQYLPLAERTRIANRTGGDLFISIHFNAAHSATASGYETFALTPQFQASSKFAKPVSGDSVAYTGNRQDSWNTLSAYHIQHALVRRMGGPDRGLKRARFLVLKHLACPGVLVELGFISHPQSAQKVRSAAYRQTLAQSLYEGIVDYSNRLQRIQK